MWNMAKFINFPALVGPSSLFCYTDWYTLQWSIINLLLFVDNMCCWSNKMPLHISSQIKSFVFNLLTTIITQQITDIPVYNTTIIWWLKVNSCISTKSQYSCEIIYNNIFLKIYTENRLILKINGKICWILKK